MDAIRTDVLAVLGDSHPMTVRQLFYRLVARRTIEKLESEYKNTVVRLLTDMRLDGEIDYDWIADNTRWMHGPRIHNSLEEAIRSTQREYLRGLWRDQEDYVEVWCEKDALAGVIMEETYPRQVPLMVARGFASITYLHSAAQDIAGKNKPAYIYCLTDWDPSGLSISSVIERRLRPFAPEADIHFRRIAVTPEQIEEWKLETRPTKTSD